MKKLVLATLLLSFGWSVVSAATITSLVQELRSLGLRAAERRVALSPALQAISPDRGRFALDLKESLRQMAAVKAQIISKVDEDLEVGKSASVEELSAAVRSVPKGDKARRTLKTLCASVAAKVRLSDESKIERALRERLLVLLKNVDARKVVTRQGGKPSVPIYVAFHWHMHQPIYWPYENVVTTQNRGAYSYNLYEIFDSRMGAYTDWPYNAVKRAAEAQLPHGGAQVSFSGSLIENLNNLRAVRPHYNDWQRYYRMGRQLKTALGNPRLDLVAFGYHHPLMALIGYEDMRRQIADHRKIVQDTFGNDVSYSKGIFPPENAFAEWMISALVDEGLEWVFVDNIHFDRACQGYPWVKGENLVPPNPADQQNPNPGKWIQMNGLWAPSKVSAWSNRPHYVVETDPKTGKPAVTPEGKVAKMIAVPTDRYMGNEDGRGGFGALNYEMVMSQLEFANTDAAHPVLVVLHHDGDNYGGGTHSYYHENFGRFVQWVKENPQRFVCTTVQDYLDKFPPDPQDIIHVEPGSWSGADNGDAEFHKWNGDPSGDTGYSPDRNSWGVMTAARNVVAQARAQGVSEDLLRKGERFLAVAQTSCYEYWDGTEMWDSHPTRACNQAIGQLLPLLSKDGQDNVGPSIYAPQREPYNPGGFEWGQEPETRDCTIWTYAYDTNDLDSVVLQYRLFPGKKHVTAENNVLGSDEWQEMVMASKTIAAQTNPMPLAKADEFSATLTGIKDALVDYRVVAKDKAGNVTASPILHVYIGAGTVEPEGPVFEPANPTTGDTITIWAEKKADLHWGVNDWTKPQECYWPEGTTPWQDGKAVDTPMTFDEESGRYKIVIGPFDNDEQAVEAINVVFHYADDSWGKDFTIGLK